MPEKQIQIVMTEDEQKQIVCIINNFIHEHVESIMTGERLKFTDQICNEINILLHRAYNLNGDKL